MSHPSAPAPAEELLHTLLNVSLAGVAFLQPVYADATDQASIADFTWERLNPLARQWLQLPEYPAGTRLLACHPPAQQADMLAFYRDTFLSGQAGHRHVSYQCAGHDDQFYLAAQRSGAHLLVSFTPSIPQPSLATEEALRASQAREQAARAEAELQRNQLHNVLLQAPAMICIFDGPEHTFQFVNPPYQALVGERPLLGKPIAEAMPELVGQPIFGLLDNVYRTGETFHATEMLVQLDHDNSRPSELEQRYYNFIYQARRDLRGHIDGILVFAYEVTPQVQARHVLEASARQQTQLNRQLDTANEKLQASNEELQANETELLTAQTALQALNHDLEVRVAERTQEAQAALHEAQQQREQLRLQQGLLRHILGQVPAAIATLSGPEHRFSFFNEQYQALVADRAVLGHTVAEALPEVVPQGFIGLLDDVYRTGEPFVGVETPAMLHDQRTGQPEQRYVDFIYQPLFDAQQQAQGILAFILDTTDRVLARQQAAALQAELLAAAQRRAQEREDLYQVFAQTPAAIVLLREPEHRIEYFNPAYERLLPGRVLRGRTIAEVQPEATTQEFIALLDKVYETGETYFGNEVAFSIEQATGGPPQLRYFNFAYQAYQENGHTAGISVFAYDVTEQVLARQQVQTLNDELAAANRQLLHTNTDLDTFVYTASHDLKAPITNIEGLLMALREQLPAEALTADQVPYLLDLMADSVVRFRQTIAHLTDISQLQRPGEHHTEAVDLAALAADVRLDLEPLLLAADARLEVEVADCPPVQFSPKNLRSIFYNLLSNAVKYRSPERPPRVQLRCRHLGRQVVLEVQDNGLGLSPAQQAKLFGMFRRLHTHVEGSGVGLYMVKRIVENAGGTIAVDSQPDVGSTFTVTLPA